jgi:hypothetical protein
MGSYLELYALSITWRHNIIAMMCSLSPRMDPELCSEGESRVGKLLEKAAMPLPGQMQSTTAVAIWSAQWCRPKRSPGRGFPTRAT